MNFIEIQSWPEVPSIGYFVSLFSETFDLPEFPDIEDLEEALLLDGSENNDDSLRLIPELIVSLLRGCDLVDKSCQHITTSNYQMFLRRLFRYKCEEFKIENPFNTDTDFHILPLRTKVIILNLLCEFRLDASDVESKTSKLGADNLRIHPLGCDSNDSVYWYFYGTRLYREDPKPKVKNSGSNSSERVWQVICFTAQDWIDLANKFKNSKSRKESALNKVLDEDFLPSIPDLFKAKEAEQRRRLLQKRSSLRVNRIIEKKKEQQLAEEEKEKQRCADIKQKINTKIRQDRTNRAQRRSSSLSSSSISSRSSCDRQFHLDFYSAYETTERAISSNKENILCFEDFSEMKVKNNSQPATKLPGRQTNNSLSSFTGQIVIGNAPSTSTAPPPTTTPSSSSRKKKIKTEEFVDSDEILNIGMHKVLMSVKNHDDAWPFMDPVEEEIAPRYYSIIKRPMDLLKMEEKLDNGEYRTFSEFKTDFKLIVNNCRLYNGQNNEYTEMVNNLQIAFDRVTRKYFDQSSSDEEQVLLEYPPIESSSGRVNTNKSKESKSEKVKKERKFVDSENDSEKDEKEKMSVKQKKSTKNNANKYETEKKNEKLTNSSIESNNSKKNNNNNNNNKNNNVKGVKRKSEKKKDHVNSKKMKREIDAIETESEDESEDDEMDPKKVKKKSKKIAMANASQKNVKTNKLNDKKNNIKKNSHHHMKASSGSSGDKVIKSNKKKNVEKSIQESSDDDDDDSNSVRDLIEEKVVVEKRVESKKSNSKKSAEQHGKVDKKKQKDNGNDVRKNGSKKKTKSKKLSKENDLPMSPNSSRSSSPLFANSNMLDELNNSFDSSDRKFDSFRSDTPEIKDKFDLIKERRNRINQQQKNVKVKDTSMKEKKSSSHNHHHHHHKDKEKEKEKEKTKSEKSKSKKEEKMSKKSSQNSSEVQTKSEKSFKESNSLFDKLKFGESDESQKKNANESEKKSKKEGKSSSGKGESGAGGGGNKKNRKRASMDVLDMETEQTLKDINKWLEHTPRFEYSSASNSPSRYVIDELDMPSKLDDDFRKPIPLMPSSPSASQTTAAAANNFQSPKDSNLLKESNNNNKNTSSMHHQLSSGNSNSKATTKQQQQQQQQQQPTANKEGKQRKNSKDKLQNVPKKKEVQRTIDRLQPGKTKGNLLNNVQNVNKPDEIYALGSREKLKEVKNSLIVTTDDSSPKLSLGTVLDNQSFNLIDCEQKTNKSEKFSNSDICKDDDDADEVRRDCESPKKSDDVEMTNAEDVEATSDTTSVPKTTESSSKPNLNAWFKAFGAPKKPKKVEEEMKSESLKPEGNYVPSHTRRLSTGSSISSSESSPHVGIDERGAPVPYPSPIGTSPMPSPKTDDLPKPSSSNYPVNGSTRVGFYQDMTSIKSSPEKSCSPREVSQQYSQYSQQSVYSNTSPSTTSPHYGNFYPENPSPSKSNQQASYSKPTHSPASYYDQYKQPLSQESDFNNSMSPSTNPNSPYHSQQSSPYQQQPNSPFQTAANTISPNNQSINPTYTQPTSPYQQQQAASSQFSTSPNSPNNTQQKIQQQQPTTFPNQPPMYQHLPPNSFNPTTHRTAQDQQFAAQKTEWSSVVPQPNAPYTANPPPATPQSQTQTQSQSQTNQSANQQINQDSTYSHDYKKKERVYAENTKTAELTSAASNYAPEKSKENPTQQDNNKYLDLSKQIPTQQQHQQQQQQQQPINQYQQMFDLSNYPKHGMDYDITKTAVKPSEAYSRSSVVDKSHVPMPSGPAAAAAFWGNKPIESAETFGGGNQGEHGKIDLSGKSAAAGNPGAIFSPPVPHQQVSRGTPIDQNYKTPLFNNPATSSMMDLTAFMRDFRHPDERFSGLSATPGSFYDKNMPPAAHMFSKNLPQNATSVALQQMFNSSMNTMAYSRDQQNMNLSNYHHNRLNTPQAAMSSASASAVTQEPSAVKPKKQKKKKNVSPEPPPPSHHPNYQGQTAANQFQQQHPHHQQPISQHQPFQSYGGLKIPPNSADPLKAVGSAFNYGPAPPGLTGLYGENSSYLEDFRGTTNPYYPPPGLAHRSTPETQLEKTGNPPAAHPQAPPASPYHHLLPAHHPPRSSYPFMNSLDPAALQQQYRMMLNQTYQGYHSALSMHNQWPHHM